MDNVFVFHGEGNWEELSEESYPTMLEVMEKEPERVALSKELSEAGEGRELVVWHDRVLDRTIYDVVGAFQNHGGYWCHGYVSAEEVAKVFSRLLEAEKEFFKDLAPIIDSVIKKNS